MAAEPDTSPANPSGSPYAHVKTPALREALSHALWAMRMAWRAAPGLTLAIAAITVWIAAGPALAAWLAAKIVDSVLAAATAGGSRAAPLLWVAAETVVLGALLAARRMLALRKRLLQAELGYAVGGAVFDKTLRMDLQTIESPAVQQQIVLARQSAAARPFGLVSRVFDVAQFTLTLVTFAVVLWTFSPLAVLIVILGGLPLFFSELRFSGEFFRFYTGRTPEMRRRSYLEGLMTSDSAAPERLHARAGAAIMQRYRALYERLFGEDRALQVRRAWGGVALIAVSSLVFMGGKIWVVWVAVTGAITLGQMTMYVALLKQGQNTVTSLLATIGGGYEDLLYMSNLHALLDAPEGVARGAAAAGPLPGDGYRLEGVGFTYPGAAKPALEGVSLHIPPGTRLGVVGANGSGKTTLVKLLTGLYAPQTGHITLDGLALSDWAPDALYARTAALFQPFQRYQLTAGENIAMGEGLRVDDPAMLNEAAVRGLAAPLIADLPRGLDTNLSRQFLDGRELSGGQWQRLALARAMLRSGAETLILDEPTAALDPAAEAEFLQSAAAPGRTVILISHRLSNLQYADRIVVLDKGRIVEDGDHAALLAAGGLYKSLFDKQAGFYRG